MPALRARPEAADVEAVRALVAGTGRFRDAEVEIAAELVEECLARGEAASGYHFLFADAQSSARSLAGYACYGPIPGTQGSFDLYWIAVEPARQGRGLGRRLLAAVEAAVAGREGRLLYADTSTSAPYAPTRRFYAACGYQAAAELPDFYAPGDGKAIYCKRLARG